MPTSSGRIFKRETGWYWEVTLPNGLIFSSDNPFPTKKDAAKVQSAFLREYQKMVDSRTKMNRYQGLKHSNDC